MGYFFIRMYWGSIMSKKNREILRDEFLFSTPSIQGDVSFVEIAQANNLSYFSTKVSYISAAVSSGKLTPKKAEEYIKDLYKVWKQSNKSLEDKW